MTFKKIKGGEPLFTMSDGLMLCNRAGIELGRNCPTNFASQLLHAIEAGWVIPVAYLREDEYAWEKLKE